VTETDEQSLGVPAAQETGQQLVLRCGRHRFALDLGGGEITLGRATSADIHLNYTWLSRTHLRLTPHQGQWVATDGSRNGIFVDGQRVTSVTVGPGTVINLGDPEGVAVSFHVAGEDVDVDVDGSSLGEDAEVTDPGIVRAGRAVAERRKALGIAQRQMAADGVLNAGALVSFEKGRSWPQERTLARLETALQWPAGTIAAIRRDDAAPEETTQVVSTSVAAPLIVQSIQLALNGIDAAVSALPPVDAGDFSARSAAILADLRSLQRMVADAAASSPGVPGLVVALGGVRRRYDDVMTLAANSSAATQGQRLYAARRRANLTVEDAAHATGLPTEVIVSVEADERVSPHVQGAVQGLLRELG
jgi:transcriptional regulator with XRE-family HTH domain